MDNAFLFPLRLTIRYSPWLLCILYSVHVGSLIIISSLSVAWSIKVLLAMVVLWSLYRNDRRFRRRDLADCPEGLLLNRHDEWFLSMPDGTVQTVELLPLSFVHPYLVVLRFRTGWRRIAVILTPDVINPDLLRRLRVRLKFRHTAEN